MAQFGNVAMCFSVTDAGWVWKPPSAEGNVNAAFDVRAQVLQTTRHMCR